MRSIVFAVAFPRSYSDAQQNNGWTKWIPEISIVRSGLFCHLDDPCAQNPCRSGAECIVDTASGEYSCECSKGTTGPDCATDVNECEQVCFYGKRVLIYFNLFIPKMKIHFKIHFSKRFRAIRQFFSATTRNGCCTEELCSKFQYFPTKPLWGNFKTQGNDASFVRLVCIFISAAVCVTFILDLDSITGSSGLQNICLADIKK